jgi:hypothetical protein
MRRGIPTTTCNPDSERIRRLESDLYMARSTVVNLMPERLAKVLTDYYHCQSRDDFWKWQQGAIEAVIQEAVVDPEISHIIKRGWCPLCRRGSSGPYESGYALPEGLARHLEGRGNAAECPVTKAAFDMARDYLQDRFQKAGQDAEARLSERRRTEPLFLTNPNWSPRLAEDGIWAFRGVRGPEGMRGAEERLRQLGFIKEVSANVIAWQYSRDGWKVLADLRGATAIEFVVFRDPDQTEGAGSRSRRARNIEINSFAIQDAWKHEIPGKFAQRLNATIKVLEGANGNRGLR